MYIRDELIISLKYRTERFPGVKFPSMWFARLSALPLPAHELYVRFAYVFEKKTDCLIAVYSIKENNNVLFYGICEFRKVT